MLKISFYITLTILNFGDARPQKLDSGRVGSYLLASRLPDVDCGYWSPYLRQLCYKVNEDDVLNFSAAQTFCRQTEEATLLSIKSIEEQTYFTQLLADYPIHDNVWLDAVPLELNDTIHYVWPDPESDEGFVFMKYTNWAAGHPISSPNISQPFCVQMNNAFYDASENGKWVTTTCERRATAICKKDMEWSAARIRKEIRELQDKLDEQSLKIKELENNPLPIGFIYVQLPWQQGPEKLYPKMQWKEVTGNYSGLFFRALGEDAEGWEVVQNANAPRLEKVSSRVQLNNEIQGPINLPIGGSSVGLFTGDDNPGIKIATIATTFYTSGGEVRPRNIGVRIWVREK